MPVALYLMYGPDRDAVSDAVAKATVVADKQHYSGQPYDNKVYRSVGVCRLVLFALTVGAV
jgi:hypothetical protein